MNKHVTRSSTSRLQVQSAMDAPLAGPRLVAVGKRGPRFEQQPRCAGCHDFQAAMVRIDGLLVRVNCTSCTGAEGRWAA